MRSLPLLITAALLIGCGGEDKPADPVERVPEAARSQVEAAHNVDPSKFPPAEGSLEEIAAQFETGGPQAALATSVFRVGENRLAFGILDENLKFVYGATVVYVQSPDGELAGPIPAPADVLLTEPRYRSKQAATEEDPFAAIYAAQVETGETGVWKALVVSEVAADRRIAATLDFPVVSARQDRIPDVGEKVPKVATDTLETVKGDSELLDTRIPPAEELHRVSFDEVVGSKPVVLVFATPQLCQSRVCGPVVDEMLQLKAKYGEQAEFIHQEVFTDNDPNKGLRAPLRRFALQTEPWLFTVKADGTIAARLEGSFGLAAFERAIQAAL